MGASNRETGPFTTEVSQSLKIKNTNRTPIAFKVRSCLLLCYIYTHLLTMYSIYRSRPPPPSSTAPSQDMPRHHLLTRLQILCPPKFRKNRARQGSRGYGYVLLLGELLRKCFSADDFPAVLLQAMKQDPPLDIKCRDKFLVQSVAVTADKEFTNIASIVRIMELSCRICLLTGHSGSMLMRRKSPVSKRRRFGLSTLHQEVLQLRLHL